jgi:hypothetical protein
MQLTSFFDPMIMPMPAEISQVNVPALVRAGACAMLDAGKAAAEATASMAKALRALFIVFAPLHMDDACQRHGETQVPPAD